MSWLFKKGIIRQPHAFSDEDAEYLRELKRRANRVTCTCHHCGKQQVSRMGLGFLRGTGQLAQVQFYCDECEYLGGTTVDYHSASFFAEYELLKREQQMIADEIRRIFIGSDGNFTQKKMEEFFRRDEFFPLATPRYKWTD